MTINCNEKTVTKKSKKKNKKTTTNLFNTLVFLKYLSMGVINGVRFRYKIKKQKRENKNEGNS